MRKAFQFSSPHIYKMELHLILLIVAISAGEALAQYFLQKNSDTKGNTPMYLAAGIVVYGLVAYIYNLILSSGVKLALANSVWNALSEILVAIVGWLLFGQTLTKKQILGVIIVIVGMNLMGVE
mgnify:CR=1 FL=1